MVIKGGQYHRDGHDGEHRLAEVDRCRLDVFGCEGFGLDDVIVDDVRQSDSPHGDHHWEKDLRLHVGDAPYCDVLISALLFFWLRDSSAIWGLKRVAGIGFWVCNFRVKSVFKFCDTNLTGGVWGEGVGGRILLRQLGWNDSVFSFSCINGL